MKNLNKMRAVIFFVFFVGVFLLCVMKPSDEFSVTERRPLKTFPQISLNKITSGRFMDEFEDYALDQFPLRENFRKIKALFESKVFLKKSNNDIYVEDGYAVQIVYPLNVKAQQDAVKVLTSVYEAYLKNSDSRVYFSMIPDKHFYLGEKNGQLSIDYDIYMEKMKEELSFMEYIDITEQLSIDCFYRTDSHWKQEKITKAADKLATSMGSFISNKYETKLVPKEFFGVYSGQWPLALEPDSISFLSNDLIEDFIVYDHENNREIPVYDMEKTMGNDMYELFLGGPLSYVTIDNPNINSQKELIIFRDSFGSSIAPLLAEGYKKVTLLDIRYLPWERIQTFVDFQGKDVLFLYSTSMLNNHEIR